MADQNRTHDVIRQCGGIVHSDGNIFFTNRYQFEHAASILLGYATVSVPVCSGDTQPLYPQLTPGVLGTYESGKRSTSAATASSHGLPNSASTPERAEAAGPGQEQYQAQDQHTAGSQERCDEVANGGDARVASAGCARPPGVQEVPRAHSKSEYKRRVAMGDPNAGVRVAWAIKVHCSKGERELRAGMRWVDSLHGGTWEIVEPSGTRSYSPSGFGGTPSFWCKPVGDAPNKYRDYARDGGCVEFCGDSIAAMLIDAHGVPGHVEAIDTSAAPVEKAVGNRHVDGVKGGGDAQG